MKSNCHHTIANQFRASGIFLAALVVAAMSVAIPTQAADVLLVAPNSFPLPEQLRPPALPPATPVLEADPAVVVNGVTLPVGSVLGVWLMTQIDSRTARPGDVIEGTIAQPIYVGDSLVVPQSAQVFGQLTEVLAPVQGRNAIIKATFNKLYLPGGQQIMLRSHIKTGMEGHFWGGTLTPGTEKAVVRHGVLGIGYYNQEVKTGKRAMGGHIAKTIGAQLTVILDAPVQLPLNVVNEDADVFGTLPDASNQPFGGVYSNPPL